MEDILKAAKSEIEANNFIRNVEEGKDVVFPEDPQLQSVYRKKIEYFMFHNEEKYRDKEGRELFAKLQHYLVI